MSDKAMPSLLFIFETIFECSPNLNWSCEDTDESTEELEVDWLKFWETSGEEIINSSWLQTYSEYLLKEEEQEQQENSENISIHKNCEANHTQVETSYPSWQELWEEHYTEVYRKSYQLYEIVHNRHRCFYRSDKAKEIPSESEEDDLELEDLTEQLQAFGLPTSFAGTGNWALSEKKEEMAHKETRRKKPQKNYSRQLPKVILEDKSLRRYWHKRFSLFSRFNAGIQLDRESWFSVTPEKVAIHMAKRLRCETIIDAFCGSGGNTIQFAFTCSRVIAIDIDPVKIINAKHNASIYGVANKIDFIIGDYLQLCNNLKGDVVFLSPPWGGPKYISEKEYDIEESLTPLGATVLAEKSKQISENIAIFLPRNSNRKQIVKLARVGHRVDIEENYLDTRLVGLTAIYGDWLIDKINLINP